MPNLNDIIRRIRRIEEKLGIVNEYPYSFERIIDEMDHRTLMQIFTEVPTYRLAQSLVGLNTEQLNKVKTAVSKNRWREISQELHFRPDDEVAESGIKAQREVIIGKIRELEDMGEVVILRGADGPYVSIDSISDHPKEPTFDVQSWLHSTFEKV